MKVLCYQLTPQVNPPPQRKTTTNFPNNLKKYKTKTISKRIILLKAKQDQDMEVWKYDIYEKIYIYIYIYI